MTQPITPELLESMNNPAMLIFQQGGAIDIPAFIKAGQANPYRVYRWAMYPIPDLIELFMTHSDFANIRPITQVFELIKKGHTIFNKFIEEQYTGGRLIEFIMFDELPKLQLDPWKYVPKNFHCTSVKTTRNLIYQNMLLLAGWDKKRISELCREHTKNHECKDNNCLFQNFV